MKISIKSYAFLFLIAFTILSNVHCHVDPHDSIDLDSTLHDDDAASQLNDDDVASNNRKLLHDYDVASKLNDDDAASKLNDDDVDSNNRKLLHDYDVASKLNDDDAASKLNDDDVNSNNRKRRMQSTKSPTKRPTKSPTESPTKSPTQSPTESPTQSPTKTPTASPECSDSPLNFKVNLRNNNKSHSRLLGNGGGGGMKIRNCAWVAVSPVDRCKYKGVAQACPLSCGQCGVCKNSFLNFKIGVKIGGEEISFKNCWWVKAKSNRRCNLSGVAKTCRETCGTC